MDPVPFVKDPDTDILNINIDIRFSQNPKLAYYIHKATLSKTLLRYSGLGNRSRSEPEPLEKNQEPEPKPLKS